MDLKKNYNYGTYIKYAIKEINKKYTNEINLKYKNKINLKYKNKINLKYNEIN